MFRITLLFLITTLCALAAPADCTSGTLADYLGLPAEGCRLGTRVLSEFELLPLTELSTPIDPAGIDVTPSSSGLTGSLLFSLNASVVNSEILEAIFKTTVTPDAPAPQIVSMTLNGASATGDGVVLGLGEICPDGFLGAGLCLGPSDFLITAVDQSVSIPFASSTSGPFAFQLAQDYVIDAGPTGAASLTSVELTFTTIPEPGTAMIVLTGLAGIYGLRRLRRSY